jgi:hypothetical protein
MRLRHVQLDVAEGKVSMCQKAEVNSFTTPVVTVRITKPKYRTHVYSCCTLGRCARPLPMPKIQDSSGSTTNHHEQNLLTRYSTSQPIRLRRGLPNKSYYSSPSGASSSLQQRLARCSTTMGLPALLLFFTLRD